ncbi:ABC transporter permease subunit [Nocardia coubleae]|uniref:ABC transporter permease subunit n=2 Tax=Nocardia coubleae TaxID=356147 RepID=A0A846W9G9_9NOCA|nr:ABC transporter permease subunit [Nocardia coubleae]NKX89483.1 ABC transporter permease subunit [Nocardia coubleae]
MAEFGRLRRWPAFWIILGSWILMNVTFAYIFTYLAYTSGDADSRMSDGLPPQLLLQQMAPSAVPETFTQGMALFGGALVLILGALTLGSGYGWGTWKTVLTQGPSRMSTIGGSLIALATVVVSLVCVAFAVDLVAASTIAAVESQPITMPGAAETAHGILAGVAILGMWVLAGALIGTLARGPALAVGLGLVWVLVVENLLRGVASIFDPIRLLTDHLPGTAAGSLAGAMRSVEAGDTPGVLDILSRSESLVALGAYAVIFAVATLWLVRRRDLS